MPARTPEETAATLENLPANKLIDFLTALSAGDLETAAKVGGGLRKAELAALQPGGATGALLDGLERKAIFSLVRQVGLAVLKALPVAADVLRGIAEGVAPGEAEPLRDANDKPAQALRIAQTTMLPKLLEQRRLGALALFDVAKELGLFTLAKEFRAPDEEAEDKAELARMAAEQGLGDLPGLPGNGKPERLLRSVPFAS